MLENSRSTKKNTTKKNYIIFRITSKKRIYLYEDILHWHVSRVDKYYNVTVEVNYFLVLKLLREIEFCLYTLKNE